MEKTITFKDLLDLSMQFLKFCILCNKIIGVFFFFFYSPSGVKPGGQEEQGVYGHSHKTEGEELRVHGRTRYCSFQSLVQSSNQPKVHV